MVIFYFCGNVGGVDLMGIVIFWWGSIMRWYWESWCYVEEMCCLDERGDYGFVVDVFDIRGEL